jgi:hypothetical protein
MAYHPEHLEQDAKEAIAAYHHDGADHMREVVRKHAADPKYHVSLSACPGRS